MPKENLLGTFAIVHIIDGNAEQSAPRELQDSPGNPLLNELVQTNISLFCSLLKFHIYWTKAPD